MQEIQITILMICFRLFSRPSANLISHNQLSSIIKVWFLKVRWPAHCVTAPDMA